jgi:tryptophan synthase alpha subunit
VISALQQVMLLAATPNAEQLVRAMHLLENDVASILEITEAVLAGLPAGDPLRADLEEIRSAARQAIARTEALVARTSSYPILRSR